MMIEAARSTGAFEHICIHANKLVSDITLRDRCGIGNYAPLQMIQYTGKCDPKSFSIPEYVQNWALYYFLLRKHLKSIIQFTLSTACSTDQRNTAIELFRFSFQRLSLWPSFITSYKTERRDSSPASQGNHTP